MTGRTHVPDRDELQAVPVTGAERSTRRLEHLVGRTLVSRLPLGNSLLRDLERLGELRLRPASSKPHGADAMGIQRIASSRSAFRGDQPSYARNTSCCHRRLTGVGSRRNMLSPTGSRRHHSCPRHCALLSCSIHHPVRYPCYCDRPVPPLVSGHSCRGSRLAMGGSSATAQPRSDSSRNQRNHRLQGS